MSPHSHNNLAAIHGQRYLCGSFGIQRRGCKTPVEPKTKEGHFEKAWPHRWQVRKPWLHNHGYRPGNSPSPCGLSYALFGLSPDTSTILQRTNGEPCPPMPWVIGSLTSVPAVDPEGDHDLTVASHSLSLEALVLPKDPARDTLIHAPRSRPTNFNLTGS